MVNKGKYDEYEDDVDEVRDEYKKEKKKLPSSVISNGMI